MRKRLLPNLQAEEYEACVVMSYCLYDTGNDTDVSAINLSPDKWYVKLCFIHYPLPFPVCKDLNPFRTPAETCNWALHLIPQH